MGEDDVSPDKARPLRNNGADRRRPALLFARDKGTVEMEGVGDKQDWVRSTQGRRAVRANLRLP